MSLPSQTARSSRSPGNRNYRQRRRRRTPLPLTGAGLGVIALVTIVVLAVVWSGWSLFTGSGSDDSGAERLANAETGSQIDRGEPGDNAGLYQRPSGGDRVSTARLDEARNRTANADNQGMRPGGTQPMVIDQSASRTNAGDPSDPDRSLSTPDTRPPSGLGDALERLGNQQNQQGNATRSADSDTQRTTDDSADTQATGTSAETRRVVQSAERAVAENDPLLARELLNRLVTSGGLSEADARVVRTELTELNRDLLFSPRVVEGDPFTSTYRIKSGDALSRIASREDLDVHWRLLQRVNRIDDPRRIRLGQSIKLVHGPFHAVVHKHDYRLDLFAGPADNPSEWVYIMSMACGLGEDNSTPVGEFVVRENSKLENPHWINPRTGERFDADNPENPIGERWIGIKGLGEYEALTGYGIHGTIDPGSIGTDASMGCVRLQDEDVNIVYELLVERVSRVTILP